jgi:adenosylcobinamide kinase/adenosylcobinamide-phosphate guanylyltransferase
MSMSKIALVTGGCRSGKSRFAQQLAEATGLQRLYIATAPVLDVEMGERIIRHRQERGQRNWSTCEETLDLVRAFGAHTGFDTVLCDCLTLWVNNLLYQSEQKRNMLGEDDMARLAQEVIDAARQYPGTVIFVTNEVGLGIVPADALSRRFRDMAGRCNQVMSAAADEVYFVVSGIPMKIKG